MVNCCCYHVVKKSEINYAKNSLTSTVTNGLMEMLLHPFWSVSLSPALMLLPDDLGHYAYCNGSSQRS